MFSRDLQILFEKEHHSRSIFIQNLHYSHFQDILPKTLDKKTLPIKKKIS